MNLHTFKTLLASGLMFGLLAGCAPEPPAPQSLEAIRPLADEVVCLVAPPYFRAVGQFYSDFRQVEDDEVVALLDQAARPQHAGNEA